MTTSQPPLNRPEKRRYEGFSFALRDPLSKGTDDHMVWSRETKARHRPAYVTLPIYWQRGLSFYS